MMKNDFQKSAVRDVHRQHDDWDEVHNQMLDAQQKGLFQKKSLAVSDPGDADEKEADEVARKVSHGESAEIHGTGGTINRKGNGSAETTPEFQSKLESSKGGGQSLPENVQQEMGSKMGADFSNVKVHTGSEANTMNENVNAKAFAYGSDIYFKQGEYNPGSSAGKELLAHELVHTVQQTPGIVRRTRDLEDVPSDVKPNVKTSSNKIQSLGSPLIDLFDTGKSFNYDDYEIIPKGNIKYYDIPMASAYKTDRGFYAIVQNLFAQKYTDNKKTSKESAQLPTNTSITLTIDFSSVDISKLSWDDQSAIQDEFFVGGKALPKAYRFTYFTGAGGLAGTVHVQDLGPLNSEDHAVEGEKKFKDAGFEFVEKPAAREKEPDIGLKSFTEDEKKQILNAIYKLPPAVLKEIEGVKFERATIPQDEADLAAGKKKTKASKFTTAADYQGSAHRVTVYDFAFKQSITIFGDATKGFSTGLEQTIIHELGHAVDRTPLRLAFGASSAITSMEKQQADLRARITKEADPLKVLYDEAKKKSDELNKEFNTAVLNGEPTRLEFNKAIEAKKAYLVKIGAKYDAQKQEWTYPIEEKPNILKLQADVDAAKAKYQPFKDIQEEVNKRKTTADSETSKLYENWQAVYAPLSKAADDMDIPLNKLRELQHLGRKNVRSQSGSKMEMSKGTWSLNEKNEQIKPDNAGDNEFRQAALLDKGEPVTEYAKKTWTEYYAESFSLYFTDRERMKTLEPNIYNYFNKKYPAE